MYWCTTLVVTPPTTRRSYMVVKDNFHYFETVALHAWQCDDGAYLKTCRYGRHRCSRKVEGAVVRMWVPSEGQSSCLNKCTRRMTVFPDESGNDL
jgi:hypothetical protein